MNQKTESHLPFARRNPEVSPEVPQEFISIPALLDRLLALEADVRYQEYATGAEPEFGEW